MAGSRKLKRAEIASVKDLQTAIAAAADLLEVARVKAMEVQTSADEQIEAHRTIMQKHLDRKDLRPHVLFKPHPKNIWTVSFNDQTYGLGPYDPIPIDDDEPRFWWRLPDGEYRPIRSMFQALVAIVQHYCNEDHDQKEAQELLREIAQPNIWAKEAQIVRDNKPDPATGPVAQQE